MKKIVILFMSTVLLFGTLTASATTRSGTRKWKASYNASLSLNEAALPLGWAKVGQRVKVVYPKTGHSVVVRQLPGGCSCFDLSDEAFRKLGGSAAISQGTITVKATKL